MRVALNITTSKPDRKGNIKETVLKPEVVKEIFDRLIFSNSFHKKLTDLCINEYGIMIDILEDIDVYYS